MTKIRFGQAAGLAAAALFAFTLPAQAASSTSSSSSTRPGPEASQRADNNQNERRICERLQRIEPDRLQQGGSRISRPVCKTAQEWEASGGVPAAER
jgi:hypothetical protein